MCLSDELHAAGRDAFLLVCFGEFGCKCSNTSDFVYLLRMRCSDHAQSAVLLQDNCICQQTTLYPFCIQDYFGSVFEP